MAQRRQKPETDPSVAGALYQIRPLGEDPSPWPRKKAPEEYRQPAEERRPGAARVDDGGPCAVVAHRVAARKGYEGSRTAQTLTAAAEAVRLIDSSGCGDACRRDQELVRFPDSPEGGERMNLPLRTVTGPAVCVVHSKECTAPARFGLPLETAGRAPTRCDTQLFNSLIIKPMAAALADTLRDTHRHAARSRENAAAHSVSVRVDTLSPFQSFCDCLTCTRHEAAHSIYGAALSAVLPPWRYSLTPRLAAAFRRVLVASSGKYSGKNRAAIVQSIGYGGNDINKQSVSLRNGRRQGGFTRPAPDSARRDVGMSTKINLPTGGCGRGGIPKTPPAVSVWLSDLQLNLGRAASLRKIFQSLRGKNLNTRARLPFSTTMVVESFTPPPWYPFNSSNWS